MAIASTAWMTGLGPYGTSQDKRDVSELLASIMLDDVSFINEIKYGGTLDNIKGEWLEDSMNANFFYGSSSGSTSVLVGSGQSAVAGIIRSGALFAPESGDWVGKFTSTVVASANAAITMYGENGTTQWSTAAASTKFWIIGQPKADRDTASDDISKARTLRYNFTQVFEEGLEVEKTREGIDMYAIKGSELSHQTTLRTLEIKRQLNSSFIYSRPLYSGGYTGDNQKRSMAGFLHFVRDPDMDGIFEDTNVTNVSGALTKKSINDLANKIHLAGGFDGKSNCCIFTSSKQARVIAQMEMSSIRRGPRDLVIGEYANKFKTDLGFELDVKVDRTWPAAMLGIVDRARIEYRALKGDTWSLEKMAKTGRTQKYQLSGQYTLLVKNADAAHGLLWKLT